MNFIISNYEVIFAIIAGILGVAALIVKLTPSKKDDEVIEKAQSIFEKIRNFFKKGDK